MAVPRITDIPRTKTGDPARAVTGNGRIVSAMYSSGSAHRRERMRHNNKDIFSFLIGMLDSHHAYAFVLFSTPAAGLANDDPLKYCTFVHAALPIRHASTGTSNCDGLYL